ncbi:MAG TPA: hypothetical protein VI322_02195 [Candidatus Saccharimonadia bacterium]
MRFGKLTATLLTFAIIAFGIGTYHWYNSEAAGSGAATAARGDVLSGEAWLVLALPLALGVAGVLLGIRWLMTRRLEHSVGQQRRPEDKP